MKKFKFKTNLKCQNCVAKVKAQLDNAENIASWTIDLKHPDRILSVETDDPGIAATISRILTDAGYKSEPCPV